MKRLIHNKTLTALIIPVLVCLAGAGAGMAAADKAELRPSTAGPAAGPAVRSTPTGAERQLRALSRPVPVATARANARRSADAFFKSTDWKGSAWNEVGVGSCVKRNGGTRVKCAAYVGLAVLEDSDYEIPYTSCDWWVETYRTLSGRVVVRDRRPASPSGRFCETNWF